MSNSEEILFNEYISFNERFTEYKIKKIVKNNTIVNPIPKPIIFCCFNTPINNTPKLIVIKRTHIKKRNIKLDEYFKHNKPLFNGEMYDSYKDNTIITNPFDDDFKNNKALFTNPFGD
jgi:hypothetical protein